MKSFSERNLAKIGLIGLGVLVGLFLVLFNLTQFPALTGSTTYHGLFAHAAGLKAGDKVRVGGAPVGQVRDIELAGDHVAVSFDVKSAAGRIGESTAAAIKTETLLGRKFLELIPRGGGELDPDAAIPVDRTSVPHAITEQLGNVAELGGKIDTRQLAKALDSASAAFADSAPQMRKALGGLSRFSESIHSRDALIKELLGNAKNLSGILADRNHEMRRLLVDGGSLLGELEQRRDAINSMLVNVGAVAKQLSGLIDDNEDQVRPMLRHLESALDVLRKNKGNVEVALRKLGPLASTLGEALASGPFWNAYVHNLNLIPANLLPTPTDGAPGGGQLPRGGTK